ncbi:helix-turn-helix transcriptional regulator [Phytoactinopolyspora limicola]|uniref:helix-turn-helix transcriptional regulator n=1 Tax=Phytoactinopolyspora limicola TaxID=2715536 RepID=UPI00140B9929|nr:helix-turn-helix transcriptional regulator [Phytoactinopolyspora limicola]
MGNADSVQLRHGAHRVHEICADAVEPTEFVDALREVFARSLGVCASFISATDPDTTIVATAAVVDNLPLAMCAPWFHNEFLAEDFNKFADLHRNASAVATLHRATQNHPVLSPRYVELYQPVGFGPELRTTFSMDGACWGIANLLRESGTQDFDDVELAWVEQLRRPIADALRRRILGSGVHDNDDVIPGIVTFDPDGHILSMSENAAALLDELDMLPIDAGPDVQVPGQAYMVVTLARARATGHGSALRPVTRVRGSSGRWLTLRGDCTTARSGEIVNVVLVIEPSRPSEITPLLVAAYNLTAREQEVLGELTAGRRTAEIAARLFISEHTVRDHIKSIFAKTATTSRGELMSTMFHQHAYPVTNVVHH